MMKKSNILILDDSPTYNAVLQDYLEKYDYKVQTAITPAEAWSILLKSKINLLVLDWEMPEINGIIFVQELRGNKKFFDLPVVMVTGHIFPNMVRSALRAGCDDFVSKSEGEDFLEIRINRLLSMQISKEPEYEKSRLLLVDDSKVFLAITKDFLETAGYEVFTADNGRVALEILKNETIDLLVSDWVMPEMNGLDLIKKVRSLHYSYPIPTLMLTYKSGIDMQLEALDSGADVVLSKDAGNDLLLKQISVLLRIQNDHSLHENTLLNAKERVESLLRELKEAKDFSESIMHSIQQPIVVLSKNGSVSTANDAANKLFGFERNEWGRKSYQNIFSCNSEVTDLLSRMQSSSSETMEAQINLLSHIKGSVDNAIDANGKQIPAILNGSAWRLYGQEILGVVLTIEPLPIRGNKREPSKELSRPYKELNLPQMLIENIFHRLTNREQDITELVAMRFSSMEVAEKLHISVRTVQTHRSNIIRKLELDTSNLSEYLRSFRNSE